MSKPVFKNTNSNNQTERIWSLTDLKQKVILNYLHPISYSCIQIDLNDVF